MEQFFNKLSKLSFDKLYDDVDTLIDEFNVILEDEDFVKINKTLFPKLTDNYTSRRVCFEMAAVNKLAEFGLNYDGIHAIQEKILTENIKDILRRRMYLSVIYAKLFDVLFFNIHILYEKEYLTEILTHFSYYAICIDLSGYDHLEAETIDGKDIKLHIFRDGEPGYLYNQYIPPSVELDLMRFVALKEFKISFDDELMYNDSEQHKYFADLRNKVYASAKRRNKMIKSCKDLNINIKY
ncbi:28.4 kDa protein [Cordyline virus 3]|uniref:28.4 kDa protein n=1 Tax=Cordyline virus 3 TaxID=1177752 RepID=M1NWM5_9CLOS|nr:28.4 kDa protein [Cordyline virus 3]AGF73887.1 28.4 kDa protein [Cordyline virus 3]